MDRIAPERYLASLRADAERVVSLADQDPGAQVPGCPGWTVGDVVEHLAHVWLRQSAAITAGHRVPPSDPGTSRGPGELLEDYLQRAWEQILATLDRPA